MIMETRPNTIVERSTLVPVNEQNSGRVVFEQQSKPELTGFELLKAFTSEAVKLDVHQVLLRKESNSITPTKINIYGSYLFTDGSLRNVATVYGLKHQKVMQTIKEVADSLYDASPEELKSRYQREKFKYGKPLGKKNLSNIPIYSSHVEGEKLKHAKLNFDRLNDPDLDLQEKEKILATVTRGYFNLYKDEPDSPITALSQLLQESNLINRKNGLTYIIEVLRSHGIPTHLIEENHRKRTLRYGVIAARDAEESRQILQSDPQLDRFRQSSEKRKHVKKQYSGIPPARLQPVFAVSGGEGE